MNPNPAQVALSDRSISGATCAPRDRRSALRSALVMLTFALGTGLAAQVRIPLAGTEIPFTLQTLAVMVTGLILTPSMAAGAMVVYLVLGMTQAIPFAASPGLMGPTGGYLVGFLLAAPLTSMIVSPDRRSLWRQSIAVIVATSVIFAAGVTWLSVWPGGNVGLAVNTGLLPFLPEAVLKMILAVGLVQSSQRVAGMLRK